MVSNSSGGEHERQHPSDHIPLAGMPLLWFSLAFLFGVAVAPQFAFSTGAWLTISLSFIALLLFAYAGRKLVARDLKGLPNLIAHWAARIDSRLHRPVFRRGPSLRLTLLLLAVFALGATRYQTAQPEITSASLAWYNDREQEWAAVGLVVRPPDRRDTYTNLRVAVETLRPSGEVLHSSVKGLLLVRLPSGDEWRYGDRLILRGDLLTPPENPEFSYREYLARQGIYSYMPYGRAALLSSGEGHPVKSAIYSLRAAAFDNLYRLFPDPEASLLAGILLGDEGGISPEVDEAFKLTGAAHIIVISGFNITILAGLFMWVFVPRLGRARGALLAGVLISGYVILVGADPPVVRAALMGWMGVLAGLLGRRQAGLNSLVFSAAVMTLFTPALLWDISFQLSFTATLGLVLFARPMEDFFLRLASARIPTAALTHLARPLSEYLLFTVAASITTLPVILYHFQRLSISSLPVNLLILPAQPAVMVLAGTAVVLSLVWFPLGQLIAFLAWPFAAYTIRVVEWFAAFPGGSLATGEVGLLPLILYYALVISLALQPSWLAVPKYRMRKIFAFSSLSLLVVILWNIAGTAPDGRLHITFLDVGGQESVLVHSPTGRRVLIGGGDRISPLSDALGRRLPITGRRLDMLVVASPLEESLAALPRLVERFPPGQVLWAGSLNASYSSRRLNAVLTESLIPVIPAGPGHRIDLGSGAFIEVLSTNRRGAVFLICWGRFRLLLPTGLGFEELDTFAYGRAIGPVSVLHLAGSGYAPLNPPEWIQNLSPQLVILTVAAGNMEGLPSPETLASLEDYSLLRTDRNGWIQVSTDGRRFWVRTERLVP
ncbi:MAG: ComEC/Rec2 family competence protein [Anaerolineae bacterium]|nr:ComEC/Rec2 family competence protein [Anaerolineae bacterium]